MEPQQLQQASERRPFWKRLTLVDILTIVIPILGLLYLALSGS